MVKVKLIKYVGRRQAFNLKMRGDQHNYITRPQKGRPIHKNSHAAAYTIISYRSLWMKAHFPTEWWAAVLSDCHRDKMIKYVGVAKKESVEFGSIDINNLSIKFNVKDDTILPGLLMIKGIGENVANKLVGGQKYDCIEHFIFERGSSKIYMERLIKLGAFDDLHKNRKALWTWWLYTYGKDKETRRWINWSLRWTKEEIVLERKRQIHEYQKLYPKRKKIPPKIMNWLPTTATTRKIIPDYDIPDDDEYKLCSKIKATRQNIGSIVDEFKLIDILRFEKEYLGLYFEHSPMKLFKVDGYNIQDAKECGKLECVIDVCKVKEGTNGPYVEMEVIDGIEVARVMVWSDDIANNDGESFMEGLGVELKVKWQTKYNSFVLEYGSRIIKLDAIE